MNGNKVRIADTHPLEIVSRRLRSKLQARCSTEKPTTPKRLRRNWRHESRHAVSVSPPHTQTRITNTSKSFGSAHLVELALQLGQLLLDRVEIIGSSLRGKAGSRRTGGASQSALRGRNVFTASRSGTARFSPGCRATAAAVDPQYVDAETRGIHEHTLSPYAGGWGRSGGSRVSSASEGSPAAHFETLRAQGGKQRPGKLTRSIKGWTVPTLEPEKAP